jgi:hypothetical protein
MISSIESVAMYIQLQPRRSQAFDGRSEKVSVWPGCIHTRCKRGSEGLHTQGMLVDWRVMGCYSNRVWRGARAIKILRYSLVLLFELRLMRVAWRTVFEEKKERGSGRGESNRLAVNRKIRGRRRLVGLLVSTSSNQCVLGT